MATELDGVRAPRPEWTTLDIADQFQRFVQKPELEADFRWVPAQELTALRAALREAQQERDALDAATRRAFAILWDEIETFDNGDGHSLLKGEDYNKIWEGPNSVVEILKNARSAASAEQQLADLRGAVAQIVEEMNICVRFAKEHDTPVFYADVNRWRDRLAQLGEVTP